MKEWGGRRYNTDFEPIDEQGNVLGGKDEAASAGWTAQNEPWRDSPGWHAQPLSAEQSAGIKQTNPTGWAEREAWRAANPTTANGGRVGGGSWNTLGAQNNPTTPGAGTFNWEGWNGGGGAPQTGGPDALPMSAGGGLMAGGGDANTSIDANGNVRQINQPQTGGPDALPQATMSPPNYGGPGYIGMVRGPEGTGGFGGGESPIPSAGGIPQVTAPTLGGGPYNAPQMEQAALLQQLGGAPRVESAGPTSQFGSAVQGSIQQGLADPTVNQNDPAYQAQIDAFRRNEQRSADRTRATLAQRANATGTNASGGFDSQIRRVLSNQGANEQDFESQLMASELAAGRDRQARAQSLGAGLLSQEQQQSLQERLANQGSSLQTMGLQNTRDLANQGVQQQTGLANQSSQLQNQGLNSQRDLAQMQAALQAQLGNQGAALTGRGQDIQRYGMDQSNATNRYGIDTTRDTARQGLQLQGRLGDNDQILRRNALMLQQQLGLGDLDLRKLGLTNQDNQYYAGLGQQLGLSQAQMNQDALMRLLGG